MQRSASEHAIMTTMAKRCGYDSVEQANTVLVAEGKEDGQEGAKDSDEGENQSGEKRGSYGRGEARGQDKRAKGDPSLHLNGKGGKGAGEQSSPAADSKQSSPAADSKDKQDGRKKIPGVQRSDRSDREVSEDPVMGPKSTTDRFIDMLEATSQKDAAVFDRLAAAQEHSAVAAQEAAKASVLAAKAKLVKEASAAVNAYVNAQEKGVDLPAGLLKLISGDN